MTLTAIVAMTPERVIGKEGDLPWHLPEDLKFFKRQTSGHPIVMGRKTFDSIGRPLPKRQNIVMTRDQNWQHDGAETIHHPDDLTSLNLLDPLAFIIGGAEIYRLFLPHLDELLITHVHQPHPGDTIFPEYDDLFPCSEILSKNNDFTIKRHFKSQS
jgi:dihydrofolate reductase